jgi:hypothetical protein
VFLRLRIEELRQPQRAQLNGRARDGPQPRDGLLAFDNIAWSVGMQRAWARIAAHRRVEASATDGGREDHEN